jgi:hypothetical protein
MRSVILFSKAERYRIVSEFRRYFVVRGARSPCVEINDLRVELIIALNGGPAVAHTTSSQSRPRLKDDLIYKADVMEPFDRVLRRDHTGAQCDPDCLDLARVKLGAEGSRV